MTKEEKEQFEIAQIIMEEWESILATLEDNTLDEEVIERVKKQFLENNYKEGENNE